MFLLVWFMCVPNFGVCSVTATGGIGHRALCVCGLSLGGLRVTSRAGGKGLWPGCVWPGGRGQRYWAGAGGKGVGRGLAGAGLGAKGVVAGGWPGPGSGQSWCGRGVAGAGLGAKCGDAVGYLPFISCYMCVLGAY